MVAALLEAGEGGGAALERRTTRGDTNPDPDPLPDPSPNPNPNPHPNQVDLLFYVVVIVMLLNIIFGIVIDTFAQQRDLQKQIKVRARARV